MTKIDLTGSGQRPQQRHPSDVMHQVGSRCVASAEPPSTEPIPQLTGDSVLSDQNLLSTSDSDTADRLRLLHRCYVHSRDGFVTGELPVTDSALTILIALQLQIEGFAPGSQLPLSIAPARLLSSLAFCARVEAEHRKLAGMNVVDAKDRYLQYCRSLPTYGITTFPVDLTPYPRDKKYNTNLMPRLLGITSDQILLFDPDTLQVTSSRLLMRLQRWRGGDGTHPLTLEFGDYDDSDDLDLATSDGESISALISTFIDLLFIGQSHLSTESECAIPCL